MHQNVKKTASGVAALAALGLGGAALADAASSGSSSTTPPSSSTAPYGPYDHHGPLGPRGDATQLSGDTADKVKAAALAKVPGATVLRLLSDPRGGDGYVAVLRKSDDSIVLVEVDKAFKVTAVRDDGPRGRFRDGDGPRGGGRRGDCPKDGSGTPGSSSATPNSSTVAPDPGPLTEI
jgi:hypothetical protein